VPIDFTGTIQCDGYAGYGAFANRRPSTITLAGCWAHVRRKFYDALEQTPRTAGWLLRQIQHLYQVEAHLRKHRAGPRLRLAVRAHQSRPIVERLKKALVRLKAGGRHLPQSLLGQAIDYTLGQWPSLEIFLGDGRVEIDNNLVENAIRPTAIGKKNWLFVGAGGAGERSAIVYTVMESCRRRAIDPWAYLRDVLTRLPHLTNQQIGQVTPGLPKPPHHKRQGIDLSPLRFLCRSSDPLSPCLPRDAYPRSFREDRTRVLFFGLLPVLPSTTGHPFAGVRRAYRPSSAAGSFLSSNHIWQRWWAIPAASSPPAL
jgi:hypothetical protein